MTQTIINLGTGGAALNGRNGSTAGADSNDAKFLNWPGDNAGNYLYLPGVAGNYLSVPDEAALDITGDIDIRVRVAMDDWTPAAITGLVSKWLTTGNQRSYSFRLLTTGVLRLVWSANGTAEISKDSTVVVSATDGAVKWVRVTLDVDNGASGNDVKFFTSDDGVTWTQLGSTVTTASATSIYSSTADLSIGQVQASTNMAAGKFYRAQVLDGIGSTTVLNVDTSVITSGSATSFTAVTGQTVTINRSTSGRKSVAVVSPVWMFGTDDFMQVEDNALLDFGASDSLTIIAIHRRHANLDTTAVLVSKKEGLADANVGYVIRASGSTPSTMFSQLSDGSSTVPASGSTTASALHVITAVLDRSTNESVFYVDGVETSTGDASSLGSLNNSFPFRVGSISGTPTLFSAMEFYGVAIFPRALSGQEIASISAYYQNKVA